MGPSDLANALMLEDKRPFQAVGVGPKMAARLVTELRDKAPQTAPRSLQQTRGWQSLSPDLSGDAAVMRDLISALTNLGYDEGAARQAANVAINEAAMNEAGAESASINALIPPSLKGAGPLGLIYANQSTAQS